MDYAHHHRPPLPWAAFMTGRPHGGPRGRGFGGPGFGGPGFGPGGPGHRGPRARRGDVRAAILHLLVEEPRNGYALMQEIEERSGGAWRPSPGSVYPALAQLEDEGLVRAEQIEGGRHFVLTDAGREHVAAREPDAPAPWAAFGEEGASSARELRSGIGEVAAAAWQVFQAGDEEQKARAAATLRDARRALYRILAEEDERAE